jgi:tripartite-type tricarboxylate transporter receptor subunit TctC
VAGIERATCCRTCRRSQKSSGYEFVGSWYGFLTQAKVDPAIITRINQVLNAALQSEDIRQTLISQGSDPRPTSVEDFAKFVKSDCPNWARAVKLAGIKPE